MMLYVALDPCEGEKLVYYIYIKTKHLQRCITRVIPSTSSQNTYASS